MRSISTHAKNLISYLFIYFHLKMNYNIIIDNSVFNIYYYSLRRGWFRNLRVFLLLGGKSYITFWKPERNDGKVYTKYLIFFLIYHFDLILCLLLQQKLKLIIFWVLIINTIKSYVVRRSRHRSVWRKCDMAAVDDSMVRRSPTISVLITKLKLL